MRKLQNGLKDSFIPDSESSSINSSNNQVYGLTIPSGDIANVISSRYLRWIDQLKEFFDIKKGYCNFKSQARILLEALKYISAPELEKFYEAAPEMITKVLDALPNELIVEAFMPSNQQAHEIIQMLKLFEKISNFTLSDSGVMKRIRKMAFERDDVALMRFTDEYPEFIISSSLDHEGLINAIKPNGHPRTLWNLLCSDAVHGSSIKVKTYDDFMKFPMFSHPINTKGWSLAMFALATENYNIANGMPLSLTYRKGSQIVLFEQGNHVTRLEHLVPLISDTNVKSYLINRYKLPSELNSGPGFVKFKTLDANGNQITVNVLPYNERKALPGNPPQCSFDTDEITDKLFSENLEEKLSAMREYGA